VDDPSTVEVVMKKLTDGLREAPGSADQIRMLIADSSPESASGLAATAAAGP
jgi:hypothetical protein